MGGKYEIIVFRLLDSNPHLKCMRSEILGGTLPIRQSATIRFEQSVIQVDQMSIGEIYLISNVYSVQNNFFATKDSKEGMRAFQEKRKPVFIGE